MFRYKTVDDVGVRKQIYKGNRAAAMKRLQEKRAMGKLPNRRKPKTSGTIRTSKRPPPTKLGQKIEFNKKLYVAVKSAKGKRVWKLARSPPTKNPNTLKVGNRMTGKDGKKYEVGVIKTKDGLKKKWYRVFDKRKPKSWPKVSPNFFPWNKYKTNTAGQKFLPLCCDKQGRRGWVPLSAVKKVDKVKSKGKGYLPLAMWNKLISSKRYKDFSSYALRRHMIAKGYSTGVVDRLKSDIEKLEKLCQQKKLWLNNIISDTKRSKKAKYNALKKKY
jgi:hypothetical protein